MVGFGVKDLEWVIRLVVGDLMYLFDQKDYVGFKEMRKQYYKLVEDYYYERELLRIRTQEGTSQ